MVKCFFSVHSAKHYQNELLAFKGQKSCLSFCKILKMYLVEY